MPKIYKNKKDINYNLDSFQTDIEILKLLIIKNLSKEKKLLFEKLFILFENYLYEYSLDLIDYVSKKH